LPVSLNTFKYEKTEKVYQAHTNRYRVGVNLRKTVQHNEHEQNASPEQQITLLGTQAITTSKIHTRDPYQALRYRDYRLLLTGTFVAVIGEQMVNVALGWDLYNRTGSSLVLGLVGLMLVLPVILFSLPAGHVADQYNRKHIVVSSLFLLTLGSLGLTILSLLNGAIFLIYGCLLVIGTAQAFNGPAGSTLVTQIIPEEAYENAATWSSSSWQLASVIGPALGGLLIGLFHSATFVYAFNAVATLIFAFLLLQIRAKQQLSGPKEPMTLRSLAEGLNFISPDENCSGCNYARSLRRPPRRCHNSSADLCQRHSACGTRGTGLATRRTFYWRGLCCSLDCPSPALQKSRTHPFARRDWLWHRHRHLRPLPLVLAFTNHALHIGRPR